MLRFLRADTQYRICKSLIINYDSQYKNACFDSDLRPSYCPSILRSLQLAKLNDNVFKLRTEVENLSGSIRECKPIISEEMQKMAVEFGARLLCDFLSQIESKCKEAERRMKKADNAIPIPDTAFYILIIIVVALSSFFVCMIVANSEILHSGLIWKAAIGCILMVVLEISIALIVQKFLDRGK